MPFFFFKKDYIDLTPDLPKKLQAKSDTNTIFFYTSNLLSYFFDRNYTKHCEKKSYMADHHPENNGDTSPHEEIVQYQNGHAGVHLENNIDSGYRMHYNEVYSHHDSQYSSSAYLSNEIVDLSKHDRETVIEESPNQRYAKVRKVLFNLFGLIYLLYFKCNYSHLEP
jgi:hypothetical protein